MHIFERMLYAAGMPAETLPKVPLVELGGNQRVLIENHCGVIGYGGKEIRVKVSYGDVCICGDRLELARMTKQQLVITGRIDEVTLHRGRD